MTSGYEKSPDYGGPEPTGLGTILIVAAIALIAAGVAGVGVP